MAAQRLSWRWLEQRRAIVLDVLVASALTVTLQLEVWFSEGEDETFANKPVSSLIFCAVTASLAWRRRAPVLVAAVVGGGLALQILVTEAWATGFGLLFTLWVALYSVGAYAAGRRRILGLVLIAAGLAVRDIYANAYDSELEVFTGAFFYTVALGMFGVGVYVASRRQSRRLANLAARLEHDRVETARSAVAHERARIARELHDAVAHDVSAALLQAEAAEELLDAEPERARASLRTSQRASRTALSDMRALVRMLRNNSGEAAPLEPLPGISQLPELVAAASAAGLRVELAIEGTPRPLPPGVDLSTYRIVQESLTNVRKHAGPAAASVLLHYAPEALEIEVSDDGRGPAADADPGYGLVGMRERVEFFGGSFAAHAGESRGFVVRARFPMPAS